MATRHLRMNGRLRLTEREAVAVASALCGAAADEDGARATLVIERALGKVREALAQARERPRGDRVATLSPRCR